MHPSHMPLGLRESAKAIPSRPITRFTIHMASGKSKIRVRAKAQSLKPYEELEIIYNGKVVRSVRPSGDHFEAVIDEAVEVDRGGWIAARAHGRKMLEYGATWWKMPVFAHSSPIYLDMPGWPAAAQESARLFLDQLDHLQNWMEAKARFPSQENKSEALARVAQAPGIYEKLAEVR